LKRKFEPHKLIPAMVEPVQVADKIFRFEETNTKANIYYIDDAKKIQIDAGIVLDKPVDLLILTHCHFDHIAKAAEIKRKNPNCKIAASEEAAVHIKTMDEAVIQKAEPFKIDLILSEGAQIFSGTYRFRVLKVPGHTSSCIALYDAAAQLLFSGDCWFGNDSIGRFDLPTGDKMQLIKSVKRLKDLKVKILCPGHNY
jgi:glyoxylase-like metal-dependent hydrolase (beta-lactamase superfamily II)